MDAVVVDGLDVTRGGRPVLRDFAVRVPEGRVTGLLGPSGCGKSTLMRAVVGVQRVAGGEVTVLGRPAGDPALRREVGYVTQAPSVYADLTAGENVRHFARLIGAPAGDATRVMRTVGLADREGQPVSRMSGGQRARVSLAVAPLGAPRPLGLDEPTVGLDPLLRRDLWRTFHELADTGVTLLVSSHVMDEAAECDLLVLMREGGLVAVETPDGLRGRTGVRDLGEAFLRLIEPAGAGR
ncbi:MAG TPA: ABC transporter ATP-binding protein [Miltoncostaeaceae bacterium]|nr:ABC transporter ATP-binding protein [Miltoncostaeaceae bacterium]